jgi:hypothetical protein
MPATPARIGRLGAPPEDDTAITYAGGPAIVVPLLAHLWRRSFDTDTAAMADALTAHHHYSRLTTEPLALASQAGWIELARADWRYLLDPADASVTVHRRAGPRYWHHHARHRLGLPCAPPCGDAATGHRWLPAQVVIEDWIGPYPAQICPGQHPDNLMPARFTTATADQICADTAIHHRTTLTRRPLLRRAATSDHFEVVDGTTGRRHAQAVDIDADGRHLVGAHQWHWQYRPLLSAPITPTTGGWAATKVRCRDRVYDGYIRQGETRNGWLCAGFTFAVAAQVAADSYLRWSAEPDAADGEFYRLGPDGIELIHRPGTALAATVVEDPDDGPYTLGSEAWPWESVTNPGQDEDHI